MARKYRRLTISMNVPLVDENLYVSSLRNRNTPYDIRHRQFDNKNSKTQKPDICYAFRQRSPQTPIVRQN